MACRATHSSLLAARRRKRGRDDQANDGTVAGAAQEAAGAGDGVERLAKRQRHVTDVHAWPDGSTMSVDPASATQPVSGTLLVNPVCKAHSGCTAHQLYRKPKVKQLMLPCHLVYGGQGNSKFLRAKLHESYLYIWPMGKDTK